MKSKSIKSEIVGESLQETKTPLSLLATYIAKPYTNGYGALHIIDIYSCLLTEQQRNVLQQFLEFTPRNTNKPDTQMTRHNDRHISFKQAISTNALMDVRRRQRDSRIVERHECHCQQWIQQCIKGCQKGLKTVNVFHSTEVLKS